MKDYQSINKTEYRSILMQMGKHAERNADMGRLQELMVNDDYPNTAQKQMREKTQSYLQANWEICGELLSCSGNCADPSNRCTDAQALVCFQLNKKLFDR